MVSTCDKRVCGCRCTCRQPFKAVVPTSSGPANRGSNTNVPCHYSINGVTVCTTLDSSRGDLRYMKWVCCTSEHLPSTHEVQHYIKVYQRMHITYMQILSHQHKAFGSLASIGRGMDIEGFPLAPISFYSVFPGGKTVAFCL